MFALYEEFAAKHQWGDPGSIRRHLDSAWVVSQGGVEPTTIEEGALDQISQLAPEETDDEEIDGLLAENACICVYIAVDLCVTNEAAEDRITNHAGQSVLDTLRAAISFVRTGYVELGDSPEAEDLDRSLLRDERVARELRFQDEDIADVSAEPTAGALVEHMRRRAARNRWSTTELLRRT